MTKSTVKAAYDRQAIAIANHVRCELNLPWVVNVKANFDEEDKRWRITYE